MRHLIITITMLTIGLATAFASGLKFNTDGTFKIVQFTDVHMVHGNPACDVALDRIKETIEAEHPDLIVFTGDIIFGHPAEEGMRQVLETAAKYDVPFVATMGNHDSEQGLPNSELYKIVRSIKGNIQPDSEDFAFEIKASKSQRNAAIIYCFDSHSGAQIPDVGGYAWITFNQIEAYRKASAAFTAANGGSPLPAVAFFHIPLPEFSLAASDEGTPLIGTRLEKVCCPAINTGLFASMKEMGDVMGIFVGHDHDNDFSTLYQNILLAYGRYTGGNTVYNHLENGARVILLKENARVFDTWIRLKGGRIIDRTTYPSSYLRK